MILVSIRGAQKSERLIKAPSESKTHQTKMKKILIILTFLGLFTTLYART